MEPFKVGPYTFNSRLLVGTSSYPNYKIMMDALEASGTDLVTVALRRIDVDASKEAGLLDVLGDRFTILPNTAGCFTAREAILTAELAREALETDLIKLEVCLLYTSPSPRD